MIELEIRMGRRRGEVQILTDILTITLNGVKVTHLMYKANLSYSTLRKYLATALSQGLISNVGNGGSTVYHTTQKGRALLNELRTVKEYLTVNA